jgi:hypothetical protein
LGRAEQIPESQYQLPDIKILVLWGLGRKVNYGVEEGSNLTNVAEFSLVLSLSGLGLVRQKSI